MSHVTWKAVFVLCLVKSGPLPHCSWVSQTRKGVTGKQCRPRSDAAKCQTRHLIRVSTVCKKFSHVSLGICKFHSRKYLKLKLVSSNIQCGRVYSVCIQWNNFHYLYSGYYDSVCKQTAKVLIRLCKWLIWAFTDCRCLADTFFTWCDLPYGIN